MTLKMPENLHAQIAHEAKRRRKPKSAIIREAVANGLRSGTKAGKPSLYDRARDLIQDCPCPRDLASNQKHLRGYGT